MTPYVEHMTSDDELTAAQLSEQGFEPAGNGFEKTELFVLAAPTPSQEGGGECLTWLVPEKDIILGHGRMYRSNTTGTMRMKLKIWVGGRTEWYLSWFSTRRHGQGATVKTLAKIFWRHKETQEVVNDLPTFQEERAYGSMPQPRYELLPRVEHIQIEEHQFLQLQSEELETILSWYVWHKNTQ